jgi:hypothetical protein
VCKVPFCIKVVGSACKQSFAKPEQPLKTEEEILESEWGSEEEEEEAEDSASYYDSEWESEYDEEGSVAESRATYKVQQKGKVSQVQKRLQAPNQVSSIQRVQPDQSGVY